ncbi:methyltransferase domain-containing protein [Cocleimonas flava]|uniref:Methyltransferase family protein n=1 Tax=Cocleimonas flava TaxID=634765 RepID=A0A4R1F980_9GAMM|nr:methyltransferase domain-containing protein [Cocleimonas flava]TCJ88418.1 methyltransferase family protein [Cocleimonas flava]
MRNNEEVLKHCSNWYSSHSGAATLDELDGFFSDLMSEIFGYYAIQMGVLSGQTDLLKHSRITADFSLVNDEALKFREGIAKNAIEKNGPLASQLNKNYSLIAANEQLPISTDNVDLVVASHILESSKNPHQVLREIDRILVPEGHCILIGFNPHSLSNLGRQMRHFRQKRQSPYKMRSVNRVKDWFSLLGFKVLDVNYLGYRPGVKNKKLFESLRWLESWGEYTGPILGNMYVIHAKKRVIAMRPDKKVWQAPAVLSGGKVALNRTAKKIRQDNYSNL